MGRGGKGGGAKGSRSMRRAACAAACVARRGWWEGGWVDGWGCSSGAPSEAARVASGGDARCSWSFGTFHGARCESRAREARGRVAVLWVKMWMMSVGYGVGLPVQYVATL